MKRRRKKSDPNRRYKKALPLDQLPQFCDWALRAGYTRGRIKGPDTVLRLCKGKGVWRFFVIPAAPHDVMAFPEGQQLAKLFLETGSPVRRPKRDDILDSTPGLRVDME